MNKPLAVVHQNAAGIDIGSKNFFVDAGEEKIKVFETFTEDCYAVRDYLLSLNIKTVAMESTGVYWVTLHAVLEKSGIEVFLVNGRDAKNVPGRKSDVKDCQWLRQLHACGLLRKSFIPDETTRILRDYTRLRQDHIRAKATQINLMQKALTQMNIRLAEVITDISGASGLKIIKAILDGERHPEILASLCHERILRKKKDLLLKALVGFYTKAHLLALQQAYNAFFYYQSLIDQCDQEMGLHLKEISASKPEVEMNLRRKPIRENKPKIDKFFRFLLKLTEGKDPTSIGGVTDYSFLQILSEVGPDLSKWASEKEFVSWLKLCPQRNSSGKKSRNIKRKHHNKASWIFRNIAHGLLNSKHIALGSFGRRIRARRGSGAAVKAMARKIACYFYRVMTKGQKFVEEGIQLYEKKFLEQKKKYLQRQAFMLNMQLVEITP